MPIKRNSTEQRIALIAAISTRLQYMPLIMQAIASPRVINMQTVVVTCDSKYDLHSGSHTAQMRVGLVSHRKNRLTTHSRQQRTHHIGLRPFWRARRSPQQPSTSQKEQGINHSTIANHKKSTGSPQHHGKSQNYPGRRPQTIKLPNCQTFNFKRSNLLR